MTPIYIAIGLLAFFLLVLFALFAAAPLASGAVRQLRHVTG